MYFKKAIIYYEQKKTGLKFIHVQVRSHISEIFQIKLTLIYVCILSATLFRKM